MSDDVRLILLADTHLGFDLPVRPRIERRRRGEDFLANYEAALQPALHGEVDLVVHAGDVFDRPRIPASLAHCVYRSLARVAANGVPVFVVPGNHERSRLPHAALAARPLLHVFDRSRTFLVEVRGTPVALSGFPFARRAVRSNFPELLEATGWRSVPGRLRLLCMHQCVEGATVGPGNFTFRTADDVVRARDLPPQFAAVLSGHIHRHQVLTADLRGSRLAAPVLYPGSIERTSLAEIGEPKGFIVLRLAREDGRPRVHWDFRPLPARPMIVKDIEVAGMSPARLELAVRAIVAAAPADAVLRIRLDGEPAPAQLRAISAARLRTFAPPSMNLEVRAGNWPIRERSQARRGAARPAPTGLDSGHSALQLELAPPA